ncbi:MAG: peptide deformylase [Phycisphaerales bacterium]
MPIDPDTLRIVFHPAPVLRKKARPIPRVDDEVRAVADRMIELMHRANGIGLAAPQVALDWRLFVIDVPPPEDDADDAPTKETTNIGPHPDPDHPAPPTHTEGPIVCINPTLSGYSRDLVPHDEGCLSLPKVWGAVRRPSIVTLNALDRQGNPFTLTAAGMLARCIQHEHDHLDGILILDKMAQPDRLRNRARIRELEAASTDGANP